MVRQLPFTLCLSRSTLCLSLRLPQTELLRIRERLDNKIKHAPKRPTIRPESIDERIEVRTLTLHSSFLAIASSVMRAARRSKEGESVQRDGQRVSADLSCLSLQLTSKHPRVLLRRCPAFIIHRCLLRFLYFPSACSPSCSPSCAPACACRTWSTSAAPAP